MARVWRAVHRPDGGRVAIKVLIQRGAREQDYQRALRREVRSSAALDHPGIVRILDHGLVPHDAAARSGGLILSGQPYLVAELIEGGTLRRLPGAMDWARLRRILLRLLDALAYAHA